MKLSRNIWILTVLGGIFMLFLITAPFWLEQVEYSPSLVHYDNPKVCPQLTEYFSWLPITGEIDCVTTRSLHHRIFYDVVGAIDREKLTNLIKMFPEPPPQELISEQLGYWQKLKDKTRGNFPLPQGSSISGFNFHTRQIDKLLSPSKVTIIFDGQKVWLHISSD